MSEETENLNNEEAAKTYSQEEMEKIIQNRIKNLHANKNEVEQENEKLKAQLAALQTASPVNAATSAKTAAQDNTTAPEENNPSDIATQVQNALRNEFSKHQEETNINNMYNHHVQTIQKMVGEDENFKKLAEESQQAVPAEVAVHLTNHLSPKEAKKVFTELLSNENSHLKMSNAFMKGQLTNDYGDYEKWLKNILTTSMDQPSAPEPVPDLGGGENFESDANQMSNVDAYLRSL